ncbi:unnamed protein product [Angiostrongylus costaricensis]|uniref:Uncharacterized protein n=1 Tax=Angiostrongylus costaricensis TaxID=334426 RepID=A0A3P7HF34_ANGCS|nr:unnamed protein product [Angiostrongylus costaricensis]
MLQCHHYFGSILWFVFQLSNVEKFLGEFVVCNRKDAEEALSCGNVDWWKDMIVDMEISPGHDQIKMSSLSMVTQLARATCASQEFITLLEEWPIPVFPIKGLDLMSAGVKSGPKMRLTLSYLFDLWKKSRYEMNKEELLSHALDDAIPDPPSPRKMAKKRRAENSVNK